MRSSASLAFAFALVAAPASTQAFILGASTASHSSRISPARSSSAAMRPLGGLPSRPGVGEGGPAGGSMPVDDGPIPKDGSDVEVEKETKSPTELMDAASDADYHSPAAGAVDAEDLTDHSDDSKPAGEGEKKEEK